MPSLPFSRVIKYFTDGLNHFNRSYSFDGLMFSPGTYGLTNQVNLHDCTNETVKEHLRGCICGLETSKPCVSFCCPENFVKNGNSLECKRYEPISQTLVNTSKFIKSGAINPTDHYKIIQGRKCQWSALHQILARWKFLEVNIFVIFTWEY